jgi:Toprim domain-containing protein
MHFNNLRCLSGGKPLVDAACPLCGPSRKSPSNRTRKVLRIWDNGGDFITFKCSRCGESGYAKADNTGRATSCRVEPAKIKPVLPDKSDTARFLWERSEPAKQSPVETYFRSRGCWIDTPSIRFLPARGEHFHAAISRFGIGGKTNGVHLTRLRSDGTGKAGTDKDKIMLGPSVGEPIVVWDNPERLDLFITEGIEDAASIAVATGLTCWAAGSAGRIPTILPHARSFETVFVAADGDFAGRRALQLAREKRPDIITLDFGDNDANATLDKNGAEAILSAIDRAFDHHHSAAALQLAA